MKHRRLFFTLAALGIALQMPSLDAITKETLLCMWDRPVLPPGACKASTTPRRLPENTPKEAALRHIDGANIWCQSIGKGKPVIVVHGGPGLSHDYLMPHMERLARNHQVIFYDQRGCGQSDGCSNPEKICMKSYVNDLEEIRKAYGISKPVILGHSWGGLIAMNYAVEYPNNVDKLVLISSIPTNSQGFASFMEEYVRRTAPYHEKLDSLACTPEFQAGDVAATEEYNKIVFKTYLRNNDDIEKLNVKLTPEAATNGSFVRSLFVENLFAFPYDLRDNLRFLEIPTLILHGDVDPIPLYTAEETHKSIPGSNFVVIRDSGHFPYVEKPEILFGNIENFIK